MPRIGFLSQYKLNQMIKPSRPVQIQSGSKSNLMELFRRRIPDSRSQKPASTGIQPVVCRTTQNTTRQRVTPSKASILHVEGLSELSVERESFLNYTDQQLTCNIHSDRVGKFQKGDSDQHYCDKCAIVLTNQGYRMVQLNTNTRIKGWLDALMHKQLQAIQDSYSQLIVTLNTSMQRLLMQVKASFQAIDVCSHEVKIKVPIFVASPSFQKIGEKVVQLMGGIQMKPLNLKHVAGLDEVSQLRQNPNPNRSLKSRRDSEKPRQKPPSQVLINLYMDGTKPMGKDKENTEVNLIF